MEESAYLEEETRVRERKKKKEKREGIEGGQSGRKGTMREVGGMGEMVMRWVDASWKVLDLGLILELREFKVASTSKESAGLLHLRPETCQDNSLAVAFHTS